MITKRESKTEITNNHLPALLTKKQWSDVPTSDQYRLKCNCREIWKAGIFLHCQQNYQLGAHSFQCPVSDPAAPGSVWPHIHLGERPNSNSFLRQWLPAHSPGWPQKQLSSCQSLDKNAKYRHTSSHLAPLLVIAKQLETQTLLSSSLTCMPLCFTNRFVLHGFFFFFLKTGSHVSQAGLELTVAQHDLELLSLLPPPLEQ